MSLKNSLLEINEMTCERFHNGTSFLVTIATVLSGEGSVNATTTQTEITAGDSVGPREGTKIMGAAEVADVAATKT